MRSTLERLKDHPIFWFASLLIAVVGAGWGADRSLIALSGQEVVARSEIQRRGDEGVTEKMQIWEFTKPLYGVLPKDIDFLVRNLRINVERGDEIKVKGPGPTDESSLTFSNVQRISSTAWSASMAINGKLGSAEIANLSIPVAIRAGAYTKEINAGEYEFYVMVEEVEPDGTAVVALERRRAHPWIVGAKIEDVVGSAFQIRGERPAPIVCRKSP